MSPLRVAVWGLGRHAINKILPAVSSTPDLELYGVCSRNAASVSGCVESAGCKAWTDAAAMLRDPQVDIVYVATPIGLHAEHGKLVLDAGKHLWCEKPLTGRLRDTLLLLELGGQKRLSVCESFMYLHHPQFRMLCDYLTEGRLGSLKSISCRFGSPELDHPTFRADPALGGGALLDVGCYPVSAIQALFPQEDLDVSYASVIARNGSAVDTDGSAVIALPGGAIASLEWGIDCAYRNEIDLWGAKGVLSTDKIFSKPADYVAVLRFSDAHGAQTTENAEPKDHFSCMLRHFRSIIDDQRAVDAERDQITRRAKMLDRIQQLSRSA
jgi:dTDP-3,4-didehydro-2,6-dideoxy-alpha-D-glucose 3-reductase